MGRALGVDGEGVTESARKHQRRAADCQHSQVEGSRVSECARSLYVKGLRVRVGMEIVCIYKRLVEMN